MCYIKKSYVNVVFDTRALHFFTIFGDYIYKCSLTT